MKKNRIKITLAAAVAAGLFLCMMMVISSCSMDILDAPTNFTVALWEETGYTVNLEWDGEGGAVKGTIVQRNTGSSGWVEIDRQGTGSDRVGVSDNTEDFLERGIPIAYRVAHYNKSGIGMWSEEQSVTIPLIEPYTLEPPDWIHGVWQDANNFYIWTFQPDDVTSSYGNVAVSFKSENEKYAEEGKKDTGYEQEEPTSDMYHIEFWGDEYEEHASFHFKKTSATTLDYTYNSDTVDEYTIELIKQ